MLFSVESLVRDVPKRVSLWKREEITDTETTSWLLNRCAQTLVDHPDASSEVEAVLESVPPLLVAKLLEWLSEHRRPDGCWKWPLGGGACADPGGIPIRETAEPREEEAIHRLHDCLLSCLAKHPT